MRISPERLEAEAEATGFRPDVLERVAHLLGLLDALGSHPFLRGKLALKGGTALNLFLFDLPRLSVDIDLNYVGAAVREAMLEERPLIEEAMRAVFRREDFEVGEAPQEHAGGKWRLRYESSSGRSGGIEVDLNYMFRAPLWPVASMDSHPLGSWQARGIRRVGHPRTRGGKAGRAAGPAQGQGPVRRQAALLHRGTGPGTAQDRIRGLRSNGPEGLAYRVGRRTWPSTRPNCPVSSSRRSVPASPPAPKRSPSGRRWWWNAASPSPRCCP